MLPNSGRKNLIDFPIKFHFIDFFAKLWLYFEKKSMKLNLTRKSMKLFFSELGKHISNIFTIIWAFTAFWAINSKEMRAKKNQFWKLMRCFGYFKSQKSKCPDLRGTVPPFLTHIMHYNSFNKQIFLTHLLMITLYLPNVLGKILKEFSIIISLILGGRYCSTYK